MTLDQAIAFVHERGVVLASGKGRVPSVAEAVAGGSIRGSWWAHPRSHEIFAILQQLEQTAEILFCRLVHGKVTLVHRRLWPALVRAAPRFSGTRLVRIRQEHTARGHHVNREVVFPDWVPAEVMRLAEDMREADAIEVLRSCGVDVPPVESSR